MTLIIMSDRCSSTILCSSADQEVFERLGYRLEDTQPRTFDGDEATGAVIMTDDEASGGHYDELTAMRGIPFVARNTACPGVWGDHLIASDGREWAYTEALYESNYPAVRVSRDGRTLDEDLDASRLYWRVYANALESIMDRAKQTACEGRELDEVDFKS